MKYDHLIVGAGFAGSVLAERVASSGKKILLIDRRDHVGDNCYDYYDEAGVLVHKYGPHYFRTDEKEIWDYLSRFTKWHYVQYVVKSHYFGLTKNNRLINKGFHSSKFPKNTYFLRKWD